MDPITTLITLSPPEWLPLFIAIALGIKAYQLWVLRNKDDDNTPAVG